MVLIAFSFFYIRTKDDSYSKKVDALKFTDFYKASINGKIDRKESFGRGGDYFSVEGDENQYHFRDDMNLDPTIIGFFDTITIGSEIEKERNSSEICIIQDVDTKKCFSYYLK